MSLLNRNKKLLLVAVLAKISIFFLELFPKTFLAPEVYGYYSYSLSIIAFLSLLYCFGSANYLIASWVREPRVLNYVLFTSLLLSAISVVYFGMLEAIDMVVISIIALFTSILISISTIFRLKEQNVSWYIYKDIIKVIAFFSICFFVGISDLSESNILLVLLVSTILALVLVSLILRRDLSLDFSYIRYHEYIQHLKKTFPVIFTGLTYVFLSRLDAYFLKEEVSYALLGDYISTSRISYQSLFIQQIIVAKVVSSLARLTEERDYVNCKKRADKARRYNTLGTIMMSFIILSILNLEWVREYLNIQYDNYLLVASMFCATHIINSYLSLYSHLLLYIGKQHVEIYNSVVVIVTAIIMYKILIPTYGVLGATIGTCTAIILGNLCEYFQYNFYLAKLIKEK